PTSAVIGAGLPVAFGFLMEGLPDLLRLVGFVLAFAGIWIVSQTSTEKTGDHRKGFLLAVIGGLGFAGFMICISRVDSAKVFTPLIVSRSMVVFAAVIMLKLNKTGFPAVRGNWICLLTGVLDAGGNIFFMLAKHFTRLDTAVVLSSLYPAATVILTGLILKEHISLKQWIGVIVCLAAIIMITL
ncbi:MAG: GRP family sugar transporter, partial [Anaerolineaceae bacterium]